MVNDTSEWLNTEVAFAPNLPKILENVQVRSTCGKEGEEKLGV